MRTHGTTLDAALTELGEQIAELEARAEHHRIRGVMAACWPYAVSTSGEPIVQIPLQRQRSPLPDHLLRALARKR